MLSNLDQFCLRAKINRRIETSAQPAVWGLTDTCITYFTGLNFQTFAVVASLCKFQKKTQVPAVFRRCRQVGRGYPLVTVSNEVILDSKLFH